MIRAIVISKVNVDEQQKIQAFDKLEELREKGKERFKDIV